MAGPTQRRGAACSSARRRRERRRGGGGVLAVRERIADVGSARRSWPRVKRSPEREPRQTAGRRCEAAPRACHSARDARRVHARGARRQRRLVAVRRSSDRPMTDVLSLPVLVLNRHLVPVQVTTVKRAIVLLYGGVALALDEGGESYDFDLWRDLPVRDERRRASPSSAARCASRASCTCLRYDRTPRVDGPPHAPQPHVPRRAPVPVLRQAARRCATSTSTTSCRARAAATTRGRTS